KPADAVLLERQRAGELEVKEEGLPRWMATVLRPLAERYTVDMDAVVRTETIDAAPQGRGVGSELNENFLLIKPKWLYEGQEVEEAEEAVTRVEEEERVVLIHRRREEEQ